MVCDKQRLTNKVLYSATAENVLRTLQEKQQEGRQQLEEEVESLNLELQATQEMNHSLKTEV